MLLIEILCWLLTAKCDQLKSKKYNLPGSGRADSGLKKITRTGPGWTEKKLLGPGRAGPKKKLLGLGQAGPKTIARAGSGSFF